MIAQEVSHMDDAVFEPGMQASPLIATRLAEELAVFLAPLLTWLVPSATIYFGRLCPINLTGILVDSA
jgi:hypothetical protein